MNSNLNYHGRLNICSNDINFKFFFFSSSSSSEPSRQTIEIIEPVVNINPDSSPVGINTQVIALPIDNTSLSSSNTDSSKKSTDNLLG